nr:unnamed protein product [Callosobruchus chinensis]
MLVLCWYNVISLIGIQVHLNLMFVNQICDSDLNVLHVDATFGAATHDAYIWRQSEALGHLRDLHSLGETAWFLGMALSDKLYNIES